MPLQSPSFTQLRPNSFIIADSKTRLRLRRPSSGTEKFIIIERENIPRMVIKSPAHYEMECMNDRKVA